MIIIDYTTNQHNKTFHPRILEEEIIKRKRPRFDAILNKLECDYREHHDHENHILVNVSPTEYIASLSVCCVGFENKIKNALMEILPVGDDQPAILKAGRDKK